MQTPTMIVWKEDNEARHVAKHGIRFDIAASVFLDDLRFEAEDSRDDYDPPRFNTVGMAAGRCINVTFAMGNDGIATIISARPASRKERKRYAP